MGYLRLSLILAVVYYHLADKTVAGPVAVYGFFILSGYVITLVCAEIYNQGARGRWYFLANRFARVWPTYLACMVLSLAVMWSTGWSTHLYQAEYTLPTTPYGWLVQFTILGQTDFSGERFPERIFPPAWSLSTEVFYYIIIGLITGRSRKLTVAALLLAIAQSAYALTHEFAYAFYYFSIQGPAVAFFTGATFYHFHKELAPYAIRNPWLLLALANLVIYTPDILDMPRKQIEILYATTYALGYIIMCYHLLEKGRRPGKRQQFFADMTYPMFLLHWAAGAVVTYHFLGEYQRNSTVFLLALPLLLVVSAGVVVGIEMPVKKIRRALRERAARKTA